MNNFIFVAHRGESFSAPENTLESINLAWERNNDAVEIDIHLTKDNKIAVIHDANTKRVSGSYFKVASLPLNDLKKLNAGKYKGDNWENVKIPSLREVLYTIPDDKKLFIEIKCGPEILDHLKLELNEFKHKTDQIKIISFNFNTMKMARQSFKDYEVFWLRRIEKNFLQFWKLNINEIINISLENEFDGLNIKYSKVISPSIVKMIKESGLKLFVWTVNEPELAKKLISYGIDGITSDRPSWLKQQMNFKN